MSTLTTSLCRSCRLSRSRSTATRSFTTSSTRCSIPPESPNYVDIPDTYQTDFLPPRRPKGILPVPREIFPPRQPDKPSKQYLSRAIPPQKPSTKPASKMTAQEKYKSRMTTLRRQHLRSGLLELYNRKVVMTNEMATKSHRRQTERSRLMTQPPREDERLTTPSTPSTLRLTPGPPSLLPSSPSTHALKVSNTATHHSTRASNRLDALHTLYMHARSFITTETQLAAEIDSVFDRPGKEWDSDALKGQNIWNRGPPATVATLLWESGTGPAGRKSVGLGREREDSEKFKSDQRRMRRIAEVLSGGKM